MNNINPFQLLKSFKGTENDELVHTTDMFGNAIAISNNYLAISAEQDDPNNELDAGAVYVFELSGNEWVSKQKLVAFQVADTCLNDLDKSFDRFGNTVMITDNYIVVGAKSDDPGGNSGAGAVYVFELSGNEWAPKQKLVAFQVTDNSLNDPNGLSNDNFGSSIAITDNYILVGAELDDPGGNSGAGAAYVFELSGNEWKPSRKLVSFLGNNTVSENFGESGFIYNNFILIGCRSLDVSASANVGAVYMFKINNEDNDSNNGLISVNNNLKLNLGKLFLFRRSYFEITKSNVKFNDYNGYLLKKKTY